MARCFLVFVRNVRCFISGIRNVPIFKILRWSYVGIYKKQRVFANHFITGDCLHLSGDRRVIILYPGLWIIRMGLCDLEDGEASCDCEVVIWGWGIMEFLYIIFSFLVAWAFGTQGQLNYQSFVVMMLVGIYFQVYRTVKRK